MTTPASSSPDQQPQHGLPPESPSSSKASKRTPLWQAILLPIASILIFFLFLEGGLALLGIKPALQKEDPFVGFSSSYPLFVPTPGPDGREIMTTAANKLGFFNQQSFLRQKPPHTFRIFCLGGSTTYGRPYNDTTSFAGWLRELLPVADSQKKWEVINAGGISYASYRVAHLEEELIKYQPDLFIVYTGHNEFLEERTYGKIKNLPPLARSAISLLSRTRTWSARTTALQKLGLHPKTTPEKREELRGEVNAVLDRSAGLNRYTRDDKLRDNVLEHYRISLERMVALARSVGARVIFVTPASNLKDFSPFKSEHTQGLSPTDIQRSEEMLTEGKEALRQKKWQHALDILDQAVRLDPRYAELQYRRGRALLGLGRFADAEKAFILARDEDICPLRALTPTRQIVTDIAREQDIPMVDYVGLVEKLMQEKYGQPIPGKEFFLDHVHPTIEGNKILAVALIKSMIQQGWVQPGPDWSEQAIAKVAARIEGSIDLHSHAQALANLGRVLLWAGKTEDAERLAKQALEKAGNDPEIARDINTTLARIYQKQGDTGQALKRLYTIIANDPAAVEPRYMLGTALIEDGPYMQLEKAAANLLFVCRHLPYDDAAFQYYGMAMAKRERLRVTYIILRKALSLNPNNKNVKKALDNYPELDKNAPPIPQAFTILQGDYPNGAPHTLEQVSQNASGQGVPDGVEVEFYENGRLKHFRDITWGVPNGLDITWDAEGHELSRMLYDHGKPLNGK